MFNLLDEIKKGEYLFPNSIEEVDEFSGKEFETFLFYFFKSKGIKVRKTNDAQDKGIDLILTTSDENGEQIIIGIQAKRWNQNVNSQEIRNMLDGKDEYSCNMLWLITTSDVTQEANNTALNNNITIKNRSFVLSIINDLHNDKNIKFKPQILPIKNTIEKQDNTYLKKDENEIYEKLRKLRIRFSSEFKIPIYMIFSNETILELCKSKPKTINDLERIKGLGHKSIEKYGEEILKTINE